MGLHGEVLTNQRCLILTTDNVRKKWQDRQLSQSQSLIIGFTHQQKYTTRQRILMTNVTN